MNQNMQSSDVLKRLINQIITVLLVSLFLFVIGMFVHPSMFFLGAVCLVGGLGYIVLNHIFRRTVSSFHESKPNPQVRNSTNKLPFGKHRS